MTFQEFVAQATGGRQEPYGYQRRLAADGLPELLRVPTGAGKTMAATLAWLYRRRAHPDPAVRNETPHWLVLVLPMRVLVEQTAAAVEGWLDGLGLTMDEVGRYKVMGGEPRTSGWRLLPEQDAIFVGTLDMLLSRALNRGYGEGRGRWPLDFGLFNAGVQWVFDEVQLMGPALPTSRQMEGLRQALGTAATCHSMWMSATVDEDKLRTVDCGEIASVVELDEDDLSGPLSQRLNAPKTVRRLLVDEARYERSVAALLAEHHQPGTRTIAVFNTVDRARSAYEELRRLDPAGDHVLLHSRFRPPDRTRHLAAATAEIDPVGSGRIVVATQVLEAGVDLTSATLFTEAAVWPSIVQRAGRCNRAGEAGAGAVLLWAAPPRSLPYDASDVDAAIAQLQALEGEAVSPLAMAALRVEVKGVVHPVLRRRDLLGLFDTTPDLGGNDLDIGRFLRENDDLDVAVAWRPIGPSGPTAEETAPGRDRRCPVPIAQIRNALKTSDAWRFDQLAGEWTTATSRDVRPGQVLIMRSDAGGYRIDTGWDPTSTLPVPDVDGRIESGDEAEATNSDNPTFLRHWVSLGDHLQHALAQASGLMEALHLPGLAQDERDAAVTAAGLHDIGKIHEVFQDTLRRAAADPAQEHLATACGPPWAKSGSPTSYRHRRPHFRHELASALALMGEASVALDGVADRDLVVYLVGAHHGIVRVGFRTLPDESCPGGGRVALGICDGEILAAVDAPGGRLPASRLDLSVMELGDGAGGPSWAARSLALRDRLGPFRLAFLEAMVICADWRASAAEDGGQQ